MVLAYMMFIFVAFRFKFVIETFSDVFAVVFSNYVGNTNVTSTSNITALTNWSEITFYLQNFHYLLFLSYSSYTFDILKPSLYAWQKSDQAS